jgi:pimeloyl-ACP methyl ester carboxylesterase
LLDTIYRDAVHVDVPGGYVCIVRRGTGPPVVLLHGVPLSLLTWRNNFDDLAQAATTVALDLRGFGRSSKPVGDYRVEAHARVVGQVLKTLGLPRASLVGSSYGASVAITLAALEPERVDRLVLINPVCYPVGAHTKERILRINLVASLLRPALQGSTLGRHMLASGLRRSYADSRNATPQLIDAYYALLTHNGGALTFLATLRDFRESEVAERLPSLPQQTLVLWGGLDRVLPPDTADRLQREIANLCLEVLPDCGHLPHEEQPKRVNRLIVDFLRGRLQPTETVPISNLDRGRSG